MNLLLSSGEWVPPALPVDRISSLPGDVLRIILGKLPMKCAVRTSVLAKEWRYKWLSLSKFILYPQFITAMRGNENLKWDIIASITNKFLLLHTSTIKFFSLRTCFSGTHHRDFCQWLQYLSKQSVEVLFLDELARTPLKMPSHLFLFEKLRRLFLMNFDLQIPTTFGQFNSLLELSLNRVTINDDDVERLIVSCPVLETLLLLTISGLCHLRIHAPRLSNLVVDTRYQDIVIKASPNLARVTIAAAFRAPGERIILNQRSIIRCLSGLVSLKGLTLFGDFVELLAADSVLEYWPLENNSLTFLSLRRMRFETVEVFKLCLSLLINCPNIKFFSFTIESAKGPKLITDFLKLNRGRFLFPELRSLRMICPRRCGMGCALTFVEFLGTYSPNLQVLDIVKEGEINAARVPQMMSQLRKCCPRTLVRYIHVNELNSL